MLVEILIFSTMALFFRFKWPLFISRKTAVILNGRALEPAFFPRRSSHMRSRFLALPACRYLAFHVRERQVTKLSTIESRVGYKMKSGEGKIWYTFAIMISRSQPRPQDFSLKKWVGREKGKAPGTRSSLFNLLDFVIYLFIYLFIFWGAHRRNKKGCALQHIYFMHGSMDWMKPGGYSPRA